MGPLLIHSPNRENAVTEQPDNQPRDKKTPYSHLFRVTHWILTVSVPILIVTGIGIHTVARPDWSLVGGYPTWLPTARPMFHHLVWGLVFAPAILLGTVEFIVLRKLKRATHPRWIVNYTLMIAGLVSLLSALPLLYATRSGAVYHLARSLHAISGLALMPLALLFHIYKTVTARRALLKPVYRPLARAKWVTLLWIPAVGALTYVLLLQIPAKKSAACELRAARIQNVPEKLEDLPWGEAAPLAVRLYNGHGFNAGRTEVTLKAMYSAEELFVLAEWQDAEENIEYWPWRRTADGWEHLVTNPKDEQVYYEDKFALLFPIDPDVMFEQFGCAIHCHQTKSMPFGLKGTDEDHPLDVWHWKASRTDPAGYVDDKFWQGRDMTAKEGGRKADPCESGGYVKNKTEDKTLPKWLPSSKEAIRRGAIPKEHAVPYSEELAAQYAVGDEIPGLVCARAIGDRGSVTCTSRYADGRWQLFIRRKLDTGSEYDVIFKPGGRHAFGCAAFDHCAKRHAYNNKVYTLALVE